MLRRYGVVTRELLARESFAPSWRELLSVYWRIEARGEIRGGRFVAGLVGEQFALPEAVEMLRAVRRKPEEAETVSVSAADPLNLVGILLPGPRISPSPARSSPTAPASPSRSAPVAPSGASSANFKSEPFTHPGITGFPLSPPARSQATRAVAAVQASCALHVLALV